MKKITTWAMATAFICGATVFTACSSDDNDNNSGNNEKKGGKNRQEFVEHTRASVKGVAENLNFATMNSVSYMNTYLNQYVVLNDDFDKTISRTFGQEIQKSLKPFAVPEGVVIPEGVKTDYKYIATVDLTDFDYTFTATMTGFEVAENNDKGLEVLMPIPTGFGTTIEYVSFTLKGTGDSYSFPSRRLSNDSVMVLVKLPAQYDVALSTKSGGTWTKNIYGTIKNTAKGKEGIETPDGSTPIMPAMDAWNIACDLHSNIPGVDATDIYFAIGQEPDTKKAGLKFDFTHNGKKMVDATATMTNTNGMTDLSQMTSTSSIADVFTAIMAGNSIEDMTLTLLDCLTTNVKVSDCEKVVQIQNAMAKARRNYADQKTIGGYVDQLNQLVTCSMSDKAVSQEIPMRLVTTQVGVDWWAVPGLSFADENGYAPLTEVLDQETLEYGLNIIDHAVEPTKNAIIVARQLIQAVRKLQNAFYDSKKAADSDDDDNVKSLAFEGDQWTALIDNPQYGGELLYGDGGTTPVSYSWADATSKLSSSLTAAWGGNYGFAEGGVAISNYIDPDIENHATYAYQLAVPVSNGSANFAVVYCDAFVSFSDGVARVIKSMEVSPTTYQLGVSKYGDGSSKALTEKGDVLTVTITGFSGELQVGSVSFDLAKDGEFLTSWKKIDLSKLGKVTKLGFTMDGSDRSDWGVKQPKYFAFDNVEVEF